MPLPYRAPHEQEAPHAGCAVIGIGASAGGIEALQELLPRLAPGDAAYGLVMHLSHHTDSQLAEVLGWKSRMPVTAVQKATRPEPGHIYVIPPLWDLVLRGGVLTLVTPGVARPRRPIDAFFRSLAEDLGARAMGVVLTGAGSDGTEGLRAIKRHGGTTLVQVPWLAQHTSMPLHALEHSDYCLTLEELGAALSRLTHAPAE